LRCLIFLVLAAAGLGWGQSVALSGIAHVAFQVPDIAKTSDFYQRLGFEQAFAFSKDGKTVQAFIKINDLQFIELYPLTQKNPQAGFMHLCFEGSDLVKLSAAYRQRGLTPTEVRKAHAGNLLFTMVGPENQNIEYTQYLPGSLHSADRSKHLGKYRVSEHLKTVAVAMQNTAAAEDFYIDKLSFQPASSNDQSDLLLPGTSGESILLKNSDNRALPDLIFQVPSIRRAAKDLKKRGFTLRVTDEGVYVTDPDGTLIEFSSKQKW
jgi:catechol 2,3-dioxygenase-like lactoylglutathione lyase family enzyme